MVVAPRPQARLGSRKLWHRRGGGLGALLLQCDNGAASQKANESWSGGATRPPMAWCS